MIEVRVGIGTVVAKPPRSTAAERARLLQREIEQIVVEAKRLGLDRDEVLEAVSSHWERFDPDGSNSLAGQGAGKR
jgi:GntR family transcriptional regulator